MMRFLTTTKSALGIALGVTLFGSAHAGSMLMDLDGTNTWGFPFENNATLVDELDWSAGSALSYEGNQAIVNWLNNDKNGVAHGGADEQFTLYAHMTLTAALNDGVGVDTTGFGFVAGMAGTSPKFEITAIVGFTEIVSSVTIDAGAKLNTASFGFVDTNTDFFAVYFDDLTDSNGVQSDRLTGTGYGDGQLILSAGVQSTNGGAFNVKTDIAESDIDQAGTDNWDDVKTVNGTGANDTIIIDVSSPGTVWDTDFFQNGITNAIITDINLTTPFGDNGTGTNNPSQHFTTVANGAVNGALSASDGDYEVIDTGAADPIATSTLGALNGGIDIEFDAGAVGGFNYITQAGAGDFMFSQDTNSSWDAEEVPEPNPIALIGGGLALLGFAVRRRHHS